MHCCLMIPIAAAVLPAATQVEPGLPVGAVIEVIDWDDVDSGEGDGVKFRIKNRDGAEKTLRRDRETGEILRRGAQCPIEAARGKIAWGQAELRTAQAARIVVSGHYGRDRYGRELVDLEFDGVDYGASMTADGFMQPWDFDAGDPKPDWCQP